MAKNIDLKQFTQELAQRQRGRACIILTRDYPAQQEWVEKLVKYAEIDHVDLLAELNGQDNFKMADFSVNGLFKFLENRSDLPVLAVSGIEFIKATWNYNLQANMAKFGQQIETWQKKPALLFVMQFDKITANMKFTSRHKGLDFLIDQQQTLKI